MAIRPRIAYDNPSTFLGIFGRWYPLLVPLFIVLVGPEIGAIFERYNVALGAPSIPHVYTPIDLWHWFAMVSDSKAPSIPAERAVDVWLVLMLVGFMLVLAQMFIDFLHGRNWGPINGVLVALSLWSDLSRTMEGFPPSLTWWGPGGAAGIVKSGDRATRAMASDRPAPRERSRLGSSSQVILRSSNARTFFGTLWDLRRFLAAVCLLAFGSYQLYLAASFRQPRRATYSDFVKTLPSAGWYRITGVPLDYRFAVPHHGQRGVDGRYIPAIVTGAGGISLLVFASDAVDAAKGKITVTKDIDGLVETLFENSTSLDADLKSYGPALQKNFRVVDEDARPHPLVGLLLGVIGISIGLLLLFAWIGFLAERRERSEDSQL